MGTLCQAITHERGGTAEIVRTGRQVQGRTPISVGRARPHCHGGNRATLFDNSLPAVRPKDADLDADVGIPTSPVNFREQNLVSEQN